MKTIPLTKGFVAMVDDEDYEFLIQWKWSANVTPDGHVYAKRNKRVGGRCTTIMMHRYLVGAVAGQQLDHFDRNTLNNQRLNLRFSTQSQNVANSTKSKANTSGFKGVTWYKPSQNWQSQIMVEGVNHYLGKFEHSSDAAAAYDCAAQRFFGKFSATNASLAST